MQINYFTATVFKLLKMKIESFNFMQTCKYYFQPPVFKMKFNLKRKKSSQKIHFLKRNSQGLLISKINANTIELKSIIIFM